MAQILPQNVAPSADPDEARLEATLASLPDEWIILPGRRLGGADGPRIGFVLIHREIGVALVDLAPGDPAAGNAPLRALLAGERIVADGSDALPIVAVTVAADEIPAIGERLADAFGAVPPYELSDPRWPEKLVDLMLSADDAKMVPLRAAPPRAAPLTWQPVVEPEDEPLYAEEPPRKPSRRLTLAAAGAAVAAVVAVAGIAATYLSQGPAEEPRTASFSVPIPGMPGPPIPTQTPPAAGSPSLPPAASGLAPQPLPPPPSGLASLPAPPTLPPAPPAPLDALPAAQPTPPRSAAPTAAAPTAAAPTAAAPPPSAARATAALDIPPAKPSPQPAAVPKRPAKPVKKDVAALPAAVPARPVWKPVASLAAAKPIAAKPRHAAPATMPPDEDEGAPPIDASDLPPIDAGENSGSAMPPEQVSTLPVGSPVPLPSPFAGVPATGQPVMLLPPVAPPAAMPAAPSLGAGGSLLGGSPDQR